MSKTEFLILHYVAERMCPVTWLFSDSLALLVNEQPIEDSPKTIRDVLLRLYGSGLITGHDGNTEKAIEITDSTVDALITSTPGRKVANGWHVPRYYYGLTTSGGTKWEELSRPDWSRFFFYESDTAASEKSVESASRELAEAVWHYDRYFTGEFPIEAAFEIEELRPWNATYWKQLPGGYRLHYRFREADESKNPPARARAWFSNQTSWRSNPWKD